MTFSRMSNVRGTSHPVRLGIEATITAGVARQGNIGNADMSASTSRKTSILDWGNMDHPKRFGTPIIMGLLHLLLMSSHLIRTSLIHEMSLLGPLTMPIVYSIAQLE